MSTEQAITALQIFIQVDRPEPLPQRSRPKEGKGRAGKGLKEHEVIASLATKVNNAILESMLLSFIDELRARRVVPKTRSIRDFIDAQVRQRDIVITLPERDVLMRYLQNMSMNRGVLVPNPEHVEGDRRPVFLLASAISR